MPGELRHRDRLAVVERLRDGPAVRVVVPPGWIVVVWLVGVEVRQRWDGVRVWLELGSRGGRGGGSVSERTSPSVFRVKAGPTHAVCWQGDDVVIVGVELWPLNLLVAIKFAPLPGQLPHEEADDT